MNRNSNAGLGCDAILSLKVMKSKSSSGVTSGQTEKDTLWLFLFLPVFALQMKKESGIVMMLLTKFLLGVPRFPPRSFDEAPQWC